MLNATTLNRPNPRESELIKEKIMELKQEIIKEAKRLEECACYSAKGHYNASKRYARYNYRLGLIIIILSSLAAGVSMFFEDSKLIIICSILNTIISSVLTFCKYNEKSISHFGSANNYSSLEINLRYFYNIGINCVDECEAAQNLQKYIKERDKLNRESLIIDEIDYKKAKKGIENGEADFKIDGGTL